jgi:hypothetical protein
MDLVKELIKVNANLRYEKSPNNIREYTIYESNIFEILSFVDNISKKEHLLNKVLLPIFSKGIKRLFGLIELIENKDFWRDKNNKLKTLIIAQFIVLNQVFGDANHRCAIYFLQNYSDYNKEEIQNIMDFTERIHKYDGDLKKCNFWIEKNHLFYPNTEKLISNKIFCII